MNSNVKKEKVKKSINLKAISWSKVGIIFGFIVAVAFFVAGAALAGIYFNNFQAYQSLVSAWKGGPGFDEYLKSHNDYVANYQNETNTQWVYASYSMFALGISFLILGVILAVVFFLLLRRLNRNNNQSSFSYNEGNVEKKSIFKFKK
ncbi:MAG: hypothetical protein K2G54_00915 [Malacoplasma sp.]|nr:hypothetical protein [Malacoplasma sp.]MDE5952711.1 hypothetical protein [Malacoplasma sp.]